MLPIIMLISVVIAYLIKTVLVREEDGKKSAFYELCIDIVRFLIIYAFLNIFVEMAFPTTKYTLLMDAMLISFMIFIFLINKHNYEDRKILGAMFSVIILLLLVATSMIGTLISINKTYATVIAVLYVKMLFSFFAFLWAAFTAKAGSIYKKTGIFFKTIMESFKERQVGMSEYLIFAFITLSIFAGGYTYPLGVFGVHEIINRRYLKGIAYILVGNIVIFMNDSLVGDILFVLYTGIAITDIVIQSKKMYKKNQLA